MDSLISSHPHIPIPSYPRVFPLYNPNSLDVLISWRISSQPQRTGGMLISTLNPGAGHAWLRDIIEEAETGKAKRSMYAETRRQRMEVIEAIKASEWNMDMDPLTVSVYVENNLVHDFTNNG